MARFIAIFSLLLTWGNVFTAHAQSLGTCGELEAETAQATLETGQSRLKRGIYSGSVKSESQIDLGLAQLYAEFDAEVQAAMARCLKGETIVVPQRLASSYCDVNKSTMQNYDKVTR